MACQDVYKRQILLIDETNRKLKDGSFEKYSMEELKAWNTKLYEDILADTYKISYGNPAYAVEKLGAEYGSVLSALYAEIRGAISYVYEPVSYTHLWERS